MAVESRANFSRVLSSSCPKLYRRCPLIVLLPASTCPTITMLQLSFSPLPSDPPFNDRTPPSALVLGRLLCTGVRRSCLKDRACS
eukprot:444006-Hanusia_phi.AAC.1